MDEVKQWQDMAAAPQDGSCILLKLNDGTVTMGHWSGEVNPEYPWFYVSLRGTLSLSSPMVFQRLRNQELVGWQSLPK